MFQHILLPTDGSDASKTAAGACIRFAAQIGARVTALHVVPALHLFTYEPMVTESVHEAYRRNRDARAQECLLPVTELALQAGVVCNTMVAEADEPYEAVIRVAREQMCDLVVMASHGRKGVRALLLGSQTQRVLTHSTIPVLVFR